MPTIESTRQKSFDTCQTERIELNTTTTATEDTKPVSNYSGSCVVNWLNTSVNFDQT